MGEPGGERRRAGGGAAGKAEEKSGETEVGNRKAGLGNGRVGTRPNRGEGLAGGPEPNSTAGPPLPSSSPAHPWPRRRRCRRRLPPCTGADEAPPPSDLSPALHPPTHSPIGYAHALPRPRPLLLTTPLPQPSVRDHAHAALDHAHTALGHAHSALGHAPRCPRVGHVRSPRCPHGRSKRQPPCSCPHAPRPHSSVVSPCLHVPTSPCYHTP